MGVVDFYKSRGIARQLFAQRFGRVVCEEHHGRERFYVEAWIRGARYRARRVPELGCVIPSREAALEVLLEIRQRIARGEKPLEAMRPYLASSIGQTFGGWWKRFLGAKREQGQAGRQLSRKRLRELEAHERRGHLEPLLPIPVDELTAGDLEDWRAWLLGNFPISANSVRHVVRDVGCCLSWLVRRGELAAAPPTPVVRVEEHRPRIPPPDVQAKLLAAIPWSRRGLFLARGLMGLRPSEARRLNVGDWDREARTLSILGKGGRMRILPLQSDVEEWLLACVSPEDVSSRYFGFGGEPLFRNPRARNPERRWTRGATRRVWLAACRSVGVSYRENESLRHAFATHAAGRGIELERIGAVLGHTSTSTTRRYARLSPADLAGVLPISRRDSSGGLIRR